MLGHFIRTKGRSFQKNERGNVAVMTAVALLVMVGAISLAIDTSKGVNNKSRLADATDAVALMLAKSGLESQADLKKAAQDYMDVKYPGNDGNDLKILSIVKDGDAVTVKMVNASPNTFEGLRDKDKEKVSVSSTAVWSQRTLDMVLVLDTTLSMEGTRLASLKTASTQMINTIEDNSDDNFRIAVVPFSNYVNVGMSNRHKNWISVPADESKTEYKCWKKKDVTSTSNCRTVTGTRDRDGVQVPYSYKKCDKTYGPSYEVCGNRTSTKKWYGCVGSRNNPYDTRVDYYGRKIPGLQNKKCGVEILEMTSNLSKAKSTISKMKAVGNTYMPSGLLWGWRALSADAPLQHTVDPKSEKVLVLMTDGENSRSKNGNYHEAKSKSAADNKTKELCAAIKSEEIIVYTIAYEVTDSSTKTLLQNCASEKVNYFNASNSAELNEAFEDIAASLNDLRISA